MLNPIELAKGEVLSAEDGDAPIEGRKAGRRNRIVLFAGIGVIVAAGAGFVLTTQPVPPPKAPPPAQAATPSAVPPATSGSFSPIPVSSYAVAPDPFIPKGSPAPTSSAPPPAG